MLLSDFKKIFSETKQHFFPVKYKNNRLIGIFSSTDIRSVLFSDDADTGKYNLEIFFLLTFF